MEQISLELTNNKPSRPSPISVKQLNLYVKDLIDRDGYLNNVYVKGEVSNFKRHYTGHLYFTLKDDESLIKCVMFKSYTSNLKFEPKDGMQVLILGTCAVYERDGVYQIYVKGMEEDGVGDLYKQFEELKQKLSEKGLFDESKKKKIPMFPKSIGVVTSMTGAVIKDIINVTTRRFPKVNIKLYPAAVQGAGAEKTICEGIQYFNNAKNVDVIIIARGGGSLEDLWPFNEEMTAYAIYDSELPVISAVGHETDFTIADFVADLRAPTPSAAGELAVPEYEELIWKLQNYNHRLSLALNKKVENAKEKLNSLKKSKVLQNPISMLDSQKMLVDSLNKQLENGIKAILNQKKLELAYKGTALDNLSPLKTLSRGYSLVLDKDDRVVKSAQNLKKNDQIKIKMNDGDVEAKVL